MSSNHSVFTDLRTAAWRVWLASIVLWLIASSPNAWGQGLCDPQWLAGYNLPGTGNTVSATILWDPDGTGPESPKVVMGGTFTNAGSLPAGNIAIYDPQTGFLVPMGAGTNGTVLALAVLPNGELVAAGDFTSAGGVPANRIARWNGTTWSNMGSGMNLLVRAMAILPSGDLVAAGDFTSAGGVAVNRIARWNGTTWSNMGSGVNGSVRVLKVLSSGDLIAGGYFTSAGGSSANRIARWSGSWSRLGTGMNDGVLALTVLPGGDVVAGGDFTTAGGVNAIRIARWNGTTWSAMGSGMTGGATPSVSALTILPGGDLVAGGAFSTAGSVSASAIARWNGATWSPLGSGIVGEVRALTTLASGDLVAGGDFANAGGAVASNIARWNGTAWFPLGSGVNGTVRALTTLQSGDMVAGGAFTTAGGLGSSRFATYSFGGAPLSISDQPDSFIACPTGMGALSVATSGSAPTYQWQIEVSPNVWMDASNGPLFYNGGATGTITASGVTTDKLRLSLLTRPGAPSVRFRCIVSNACGSATSDSATLTICFADFNCDGATDFFDYDDFVVAFESGDVRADFDGDGTVDFFDYDAFVVGFETPC